MNKRTAKAIGMADALEAYARDPSLDGEGIGEAIGLKLGGMEFPPYGISGALIKAYEEGALEGIRRAKDGKVKVVVTNREGAELGQMEFIL